MNFVVMVMVVAGKPRALTASHSSQQRLNQNQDHPSVVTTKCLVKKGAHQPAKCFLVSSIVRYDKITSGEVRSDE